MIGQKSNTQMPECRHIPLRYYAFQPKRESNERTLGTRMRCCLFLGHMRGLQTRPEGSSAPMPAALRGAEHREERCSEGIKRVASPTRQCRLALPVSDGQTKTPPAIPAGQFLPGQKPTGFRRRPRPGPCRATALHPSHQGRRSSSGRRHRCP